MQICDKAMPGISLAGHGQMLMTLKPHGMFCHMYVLIKFCIPIHFNIVCTLVCTTMTRLCYAVSFLYINICWTPRVMLKSVPERLV